MAAVFRRFRSAQIRAIGNTKLPSFINSRSFASSSILQNDSIGLAWRKKSDPTKEPHSRMLSDKGVIYALHTHNIRPDSTDNYLTNYEEVVNILNSKKSELQLELVGSWTVTAGDIDQALHLWRYNGGYDSVDRTQVELSQNKAYQQLFKEGGKYVRSRYLQYLLAFSYWPVPTKREDSNIYEIRSYRLNAGGMIEWGNNWAKAINFRRHNNEPFGGFFSQIGRLYNVHHIWCYKSLQARMETRESAWRSPGWDRCVAHTVPIIRETHSRILSPTSFSPTK
ncbi:PREDICTED: protein NipSnap [Dufourea novaeangliae]|uniref:protein NipSnap n=1 Tax=Dufourea novaeangliae TaxID=178035 RepID=UPI000767121D|nr:PREDICTED: protein NipSnap [Dufourea novaeangliae]XP_015438753.1 PREDICTED: protein NipSnap [Dufourea novaeangliae]